MNILHLYPEIMITCGVTRNISQLMGNLGGEYRQYAATFGGDAEEKFRLKNFPVLLLPSGVYPYLLPVHIGYIGYWCSRFDINILHAHHRYFDLAGYFVSRLMKIPLITTVHSKVYDKRALSYKADFLIAPGNEIQNHLINTFGISARRIRVIKNFIDPHEYTSHTVAELTALKKSLSIPDNKKVVLFAGRMSREKGVDILLNSVKLLQTKRDDFFLLMAGSGEELEYVRNFGLDHLKNFHLLPPAQNISILYQIADIVVMPSRVDPFPISMIEAGFFSKALLASRVDGLAEFIKHKHNGFLTEPGNVESLVNAINTLLNDDDMRKTLAGNLHTEVISDYLVSQRMNDYISFYQKAMAPND